MILCKDLEGRFTFANQKFCAELGTTLEEIKGKTDFDFFPKRAGREVSRATTARSSRAGRSSTSSSSTSRPRGEKLYVQVDEDAALRARRRGRSASRASSGT